MSDVRDVHVDDVVNGHRLVMTGRSDGSRLLLVCKRCKETLLDERDVEDPVALVELAVENHV